MSIRAVTMMKGMAAVRLRREAKSLKVLLISVMAEP